MSKESAHAKATFDVIYRMEGEVADMERWARLIEDLGTCEADVSPGGLHVAGGEMRRVAASLREQWTQAFDLARLAAGGPS